MVHGEAASASFVSHFDLSESPSLHVDIKPERKVARIDQPPLVVYRR